MALINPTLPTIGQPNSTEDQDVINALTTIISAINGGLDTANIAATAGITGAQLAAAAGITGAQLAAAAGITGAQLAAAAGITGAQLATAVQAAAGLNGASIRRGKSIVAATESRTNTAYGLMTTPDRVSNIVMPTDGLMFIGYQATWQESVQNAARAALFIGVNQIKVGYALEVNPTVQEALLNVSSPPKDVLLATTWAGLRSSSPTASAAVGNYAGDVTTGQVIGGGYSTDPINLSTSGYFHTGGPCVVFAAAGTYDVSVQFKASSGSVTAKNRKLWVWTLGFD